MPQRHDHSDNPTIVVQQIVKSLMEIDRDEIDVSPTLTDTMRPLLWVILAVAMFGDAYRMRDGLDEEEEKGKFTMMTANALCSLLDISVHEMRAEIERMADDIKAGKDFTHDTRHFHGEMYQSEKGETL